LTDRYAVGSDSMEEVVFSCYGVEIRLVDDAATDICQRLRDALPSEVSVPSPCDAMVVVSYAITAAILPDTTNQLAYRIARDGINLRVEQTEEGAFQWLRRDIDCTVSQCSRQMLFVHAGVVGWRGLAIVIPGRSHSGKSTLVVELVRRGAVYYSDEFAVLDETGRVHPYRRTPVLRDDERRLQDLRLTREDEPTEPLSIGLIVEGAYQPGVNWRPTIVRGARAVLPLIDGMVLGRQESARMLRIAARVAPTAVVLRGLRSEAMDVAAQLLDLVDDALVSRALGAGENGSSDLTTDLSRVADLRLRSRTSRPAPTERRLLVARYVRLTDFLSPAQHQKLLEHALACQAEFKELGIVGRQGEDTLNYHVRRSRTLYGARLDEIWDMFDRRLHGILPGVRKELGMAWFHLGKVERQLTAHGSGGFFAPHRDNGHAIAKNRRVSCVYYFHASPRRFTGGELRLYDTWMTPPSGSTAAATYTTVTPVNNSIVFFPSDMFHEVRPVRCETDAFASSRFTVTIWFHEGPRPTPVEESKAPA
jgi:Rps23 Pro-64 3,4-dihydroxylase Tpa1-like proline 4-hydroxylase